MISRLKLFFADKTRRRIIYFFLIILLISKYQQKKEMREYKTGVDQFNEQKNILRNELDDIIDVHDNLLEEYGDLFTQLDGKDSLIQQYEAEITELIAIKDYNEQNLEVAREKIEVLKEISKRYIANIDSLLYINEELQRKKDSVISVNKDINWRNYKLNKQNQELNEVVNRGSVLKIDNIDVQAIKYKVTGKEARTRRAKKTQKIEVCFSILENPIAKRDYKTVFMQLVDPNNNIINNIDTIQLNIEGKIVSFTDSTTFYYENSEMMHCFDWERVDVLESGVYLIYLYLDNQIASEKVLILK